MSFGSSYDAWLEAPYVEAAAKGDAYANWCEENDKDPEEDHWDEFEQEMADRADDAAEERAEAMREDRDRDW
jgi:hypothetical protein